MVLQFRANQKKGETEEEGQNLEGRVLDTGSSARDNQCSKQARGTVAAGSVVGTVRYSGGRRGKGMQGKDEGGGGVDRKWGSWKRRR